MLPNWQKFPESKDFNPRQRRTKTFSQNFPNFHRIFRIFTEFSEISKISKITQHFPEVKIFLNLQLKFFFQTQPTELYQPQGGITYYSADQQVAPRPAPQKRPKAAIPIIAPPEERKDGYVVEEYSVPDNSSNATSEIPQWSSKFIYDFVR